MENIELFTDSFQNYRKYLTCKAQLVISDVPYGISENAYGSNPCWYVGGDNKNGESELAKSQFFYNDKEFRPAEFMHFCSKLLINEPKQGMTDEEYEKAEKIGGGKKVKSKAPCMVLFCNFDQLQYFIDLGKRYGFMHYIPLVFRKNYSAQVLKANMKIVGNCEYGLVLYKDKLPKFNNHGKMVMNCIDYPRDNKTPKIHPTQKSVPLLEFLIELFTDPGDVVIDPCAGSGSALFAAGNLGRKAYGFEVNKEYVKGFYDKLYPLIKPDMFVTAELEEIKKQREQQRSLFKNE